MWTQEQYVIFKADKRSDVDVAIMTKKHGKKTFTVFWR